MGSAASHSAGDAAVGTPPWWATKSAYAGTRASARRAAATAAAVDRASPWLAARAAVRNVGRVSRLARLASRTPYNRGVVVPDMVPASGGPGGRDIGTATRA